MLEREGKFSSTLKSWEQSTQFKMYWEPREVSVIRLLFALVPAALAVIHTNVGSPFLHAKVLFVIYLYTHWKASCLLVFDVE